MAGLVEAIEKNVEGINNFDLCGFLSGIPRGEKTLILGCTHYFFVKSGIENHLKPQTVKSGLNPLIFQMQTDGLLGKNKRKSQDNSYTFIGENRKKNERVFGFLPET